MNQYYEDLIRFRGAPALIKTVRRWETLSKNIKNSHAEDLNILPDMLWISQRGINKTLLLTKLSNYLYSLDNLMLFSGKERFLEFNLGYTNPGTAENSFPELLRFIRKVEDLKGYTSEFHGVVYIDISEWLTHTDEKAFTAFIEYIATNTDKWFVIFNVSGGKPEEVNKLESMLSLYLRIETIKIDYPKTDDLFNVAMEILGSYGFEVDDDGKKLLKESINTMRKKKYFDGFISVRCMCSDIIYETLSKKETDLYSLTAADLSGFAKDSDYVRRIVANYDERKKRIGFLKEEDND